MADFDLIESLKKIPAVEATAASAAATANAAQGVANAAQGTANSASSKADTAQARANSAYSLAEQVYNRPIPQPNPDTAQSSATAIGACVLARYQDNLAPGAVVAGAALRWANADGASGGVSDTLGAGSWRLHGRTSTLQERGRVSIFQRIV